ncbi:DUF1343 domain-containing protein [Treponema pedis]|uniref:DUF1343 domain-containing protein n=1 Tax=Treponema pedis TaxID=409322 RepID=UPI00040EDBAB|nr:DUF1343 domain-containing protein [Treponema pedis]
MKKSAVIFYLLILPIFLFTRESGRIVLGIDRIKEFEHLFKNKRVGLITNQTGINGEGKSSIDVLYKTVNLTALFSPEHGIRGNEREGAIIENRIDLKTGLTVYSLYGKTKRPSEEMLKNIDILCFDIQDIGARFYTYIWTMAYAMEECAKHKKTFVVFDRPNPINGVNVEGNILNEEYKSFVGYFPIIQRHGMTVGELALMFNKEFKINCNLQIIPLKNWNRENCFEELNLMWVPTSPNIPTAETALIYSGLCIFEGVNISVGRGTAMPFKYIGAPFIDAENLAEELNALNLKGVFFLPAYFTPALSLYKNEFCKGIQIIVTDKKEFLPVKTSILIMEKIKKMYPENFSVNDSKRKLCGLNLLTGTNLLTSILSHDKTKLEEYFKVIRKDEIQFSKLRKKYLLY